MLFSFALKRILFCDSLLNLLLFFSYFIWFIDLLNYYSLFFWVFLLFFCYFIWNYHLFLFIVLHSILIGLIYWDIFNYYSIFFWLFLLFFSYFHLIYWEKYFFLFIPYCLLGFLAISLVVSFDLLELSSISLYCATSCSY